MKIKNKQNDYKQLGGFCQLMQKNIGDKHLMDSKKPPEWVEVIPKGPQITTRDKRSFNLTNPQKLVENFIADDKKIIFDFNHQSEWCDKFNTNYTLAGWGEKLENRDGAIWAKVEWQPEGKNAIETGQYRYLSPVLQINSDDNEIYKIDSIALTNDPALKIKGLFKNQQNTNNDNTDRQVNVKDYIALKQKYDQLNDKWLRLEQQRHHNTVRTTIDEAIIDGKIIPASRSYHLQQCQDDKGFENFKNYIKTAPQIITKGEIIDKQFSQKYEIENDEIEICKQLGITAEEFYKQKQKISQK